MLCGDVSLESHRHHILPLHDLLPLHALRVRHPSCWGYSTFPNGLRFYYRFGSIPNKPTRVVGFFPFSFSLKAKILLEVHHHPSQIDLQPTTTTTIDHHLLLRPERGRNEEAFIASMQGTRVTARRTPTESKYKDSTRRDSWRDRGFTDIQGRRGRRPGVRIEIMGAGVPRPKKMTKLKMAFAAPKKPGEFR